MDIFELCAVVGKMTKFKTLLICLKRSVLSFFIHIFDMSIIYLQSIEKIQWTVGEECFKKYASQ